MAVALVAFCWLAVPAAAAVLPIGEPVPPIDVAPVPDRLAAGSAAVPEAVASVTDASRPVRRSAVGTAQSVTGAVDRGHPAVAAVVRGAAETVSGVADRVAPAARKVTEGPGVVTGPATPAARDLAAPPAERAGGAEPRRAAHPVDGAGGGESARAARLQGRRAEAARRSESASPKAQGAAPPVGPTPRPGLAGAPPGARPAAGAAQAALDHRTSPEPAPTAGGGSAVSAGAASFLLGGLAVLLATLSLAGQALRRRLPSRTVTAWPSAFVPLLERPG